jgi:glutamate-1-semialdehyde 2,1-aminomutase
MTATVDNNCASIDRPATTGGSVPQTPSRSFAGSNAIQARLHELVPGGAHTYARGDDQYPVDMAPVLVRGDGARVWDVDNNEYIEYGMGLRSVVLGHGYRPVVEAVSAAIADGVNFTRPTQLELAAAEDFLNVVPGAEMVKFAKNGSDVTSAAIRLARAATGRDAIAVCNHPFFSVDDWFIVTTEMSSGIPRAAAAQSLRFEYNQLNSLELLFADHPDSIAAVIMEAATAMAEPAPGFLEGVRALCDRHGAVLIFDEIITGFRWSMHGAQTMYGVTPDLSCWGKAMGNGFPISALAGRRELMELGGLNTDRDRVFLLSTTFGAETAGLAAFRAVVAAYRDGDPIGRMEACGTRLAAAVNEIADAMGLKDHFQVLGRPSCLVFATRDAQGHPSQAFRTLFLQELLQRGVLGQSFVVSAAHTATEIEETIDVVGQALHVYARAVDAGSTDGFLSGAAVAPALRRSAHPRRLGA